HAGSAGDVDENFYASVHRYMERQAAPAQAVDAMRFIEALARWDTAAAADYGDRPLPDARDRHPWGPVRPLLDGAAMAKLAQGDVEGARRFRDTLSKYSGRDVNDARQLLLDAYIARPQLLQASLDVARR